MPQPDPRLIKRIVRPLKHQVDVPFKTDPTDELDAQEQGRLPMLPKAPGAGTQGDIYSAPGATDLTDIAALIRAVLLSSASPPVTTFETGFNGASIPDNGQSVSIYTNGLNRGVVVTIWGVFTTLGGRLRFSRDGTDQTIYDEIALSGNPPNSAVSLNMYVRQGDSIFAKIPLVGANAGSPGQFFPLTDTDQFTIRIFDPDVLLTSQ